MLFYSLYVADSNTTFVFPLMQADMTNIFNVFYKYFVGHHLTCKYIQDLNKAYEKRTIERSSLLNHQGRATDNVFLPACIEYIWS